ncbi:hypothetical protein CkaCkLH20_09678 [Colletotrichum karsti]|uniref:Heterokaryon incompatibility domain-containing protein n=1 Tax=Colletotrichum karsti TaxID=1095194 RepID=A0A9P6I6C7_9PEZI|nr:uncharacterized protein CkaCkLH20_09678 [Colletotrichum karsti]KAF9872815.1 hypothetical protein CkaCkLH20_09678 [Colletotrichum karsti]
MSRWHHSSCASPLVVVEQNQPTCKSCGNLPDVDALIKAQTTSSSIPDLPPDEPHGQYNLWWPPSITYVTEAPDGTRTRVTPPDEKNSATASGNTKTSPSHQNVIYPASLKSNEFRVLLMSPVDDVDYPVHVDLEKCHDDGHSEYETASYTWGGEDRDITPCKPLFIGPYWDVLLQTRNCWELLRHLRPRRGLRTVWVDAICINQSDLKEREAQVAKMGRIYRNALRVVLYLGPDLAPPTSSSSTYPIRHDLYGFDSLKENTKSRSFRSASDPLLLSKVFQREYFRRVWIVQELVLSRLITFRVGDVEFMVDSGQLFDEENEINIENAIIPWFKFATKRSQEGRGAGAYDDFLYFHLRWKRRPNELDELADLKKSNDHGCKGFDVLKAIGQHAGETLWITFDWITLECWALSHEFIGDWKDLKHYCKEGEDAMDLIEKGPKEKDRDIQAPRWPREFVERLGIDGSTWEVTIV